MVTQLQQPSVLLTSFHNNCTSSPSLSMSGLDAASRQLESQRERLLLPPPPLTQWLRLSDSALRRESDSLSLFLPSSSLQRTASGQSLCTQVLMSMEIKIKVLVNTSMTSVWLQLKFYIHPLPVWGHADDLVTHQGSSPPAVETLISMNQYIWTLL